MQNRMDSLQFTKNRYYNFSRIMMHRFPVIYVIPRLPCHHLSREPEKLISSSSSFYFKNELSVFAYTLWINIHKKDKIRISLFIREYVKILIHPPPHLTCEQILKKAKQHTHAFLSSIAWFIDEEAVSCMITLRSYQWILLKILRTKKGKNKRRE